jgi:hypothetical protein
MADFSDVMSGATGGALAGASFGPWGAGIGAGVGALGSLFGPSAAEQRKSALGDTMSLINQLKAETERRRQAETMHGVRTLGRIGQSMIGNARGAAASRMAALGRSDETESAVLPAEQGVASNVNRNIGGFVDTTNSRYDQEQGALDSAKINAQMAYNQTPLSPSVGQTFLATGSALGQYGQMRSYIDALKNYSDQGGQSDQGTGGGYMGNASNPNSLANAGRPGNPWHL